MVWKTLVKNKPTGFSGFSKIVVGSLGPRSDEPDRRTNGGTGMDRSCRRSRGILFVVCCASSPKRHFAGYPQQGQPQLTPEQQQQWGYGLHCDIAVDISACFLFCLPWGAAAPQTPALFWGFSPQDPPGLGGCRSPHPPRGGGGGQTQ